MEKLKVILKGGGQIFIFWLALNGVAWAVASSAVWEFLPIHFGILRASATIAVIVWVVLSIAYLVDER